MPKHGITALVDFVEPFEAKKAFTKLAYSQFKAAPLYLEWAPENVFIKSAEIIPSHGSDEEQMKTIVNIEEKEIKRKTDSIGNEIHVKDTSQNNVDDDVDTEEPENATTLFVKNLNFKTTETSLKSVSCTLFLFNKENNCNITVPLSKLTFFLAAFFELRQYSQCIYSEEEGPKGTWAVPFYGVWFCTIL